MFFDTVILVRAVNVRDPVISHVTSHANVAVNTTNERHERTPRNRETLGRLTFSKSTAEEISLREQIM